MNIFFQRQQNLTGIDGFDEVVGNLRTDSLIHDILLFALRTHDNGGIRRNLLDSLQGLQTCQTRHHLIQQNQVERMLAALFYRIRAIGDRDDLIAFFLQKDNMSLQQLYLIVNPQ